MPLGRPCLRPWHRNSHERWFLALLIIFLFSTVQLAELRVNEANLCVKKGSTHGALGRASQVLFV